jgi:hypothetical protein
MRALSPITSAQSKSWGPIGAERKGNKMKKAMMLSLLGIGSICGLGSTSLASGDPSSARLLEITNVAGDIEVRTSPGAAFDVQIIPGRRMSAQVERDGITLRVKGPLPNGNTRSSCNNWGNGSQNDGEMTINGTRYVQGDLPRIVVTGPDTMGLRIKRSLVKGQIGNVGGATISHTSCGDLVVGNIARDLEANIAGSGDFKVGNIGGGSEVNLAGSGDVELGRVRGDLELNAAGSGGARIDDIQGRANINIAGSGDVEIASVGREVEVNVAGSGDVTLKSGQSQLEANIAGSGDIRHNGTVINPSVSIVGSGNVIVARLEGQPRVSKLGSGTFRVK